jgi:hypothetical protein
MAKYHKAVYDRVAAADMSKPGVRLAAACIDAQIPVQVVARWMGITRQGVYYWFFGETEVAEHNVKKVELITRVLVSAVDDNALPVKDLATAMNIVKKYKEMVK